VTGWRSAFGRWLEHRRSIAQRLHDGCHQDLSVAALEIGRALRALPEADALRPALVTAAEQVERVQRELRSVTSELFPPALPTMGIAEALRSDGRRGPIAVSVEGGLDVGVPRDVEAAAFFLCRDALAVLADAGVADAEVRLSTEGNAVEIAIAAPIAVSAGVADELADVAAAYGARAQISARAPRSLVLSASWPAEGADGPA
jgi:signal transduction histidine kinase